MSVVRIALAHLPHPRDAEESVALAVRAIAEAAGAAVVCFPEAYVPGYRNAPPEAPWLERAWASVANAAAGARVAVVLGTHRIVETAVRISALVINGDGAIAGFQDKVQLDPSEEGPSPQGRSGASSRRGP